MRVRFISHPRYGDAHQDEEHEPWANKPCTRCAIAECVETKQRFLLWSHDDTHWSLNRNDPAYGKVEPDGFEFI